jgi:hypothetical protein
MMGEFAKDLASVARTCRRFYQLAMPTLWHKIDLWPIFESPRYLSAYPDTGSKRALSFVRKVSLSLYKEPALVYPVEDGLKALFDFVSGCLRVLKDTRAIEAMYLRVGLYDPLDFVPECTQVIEAFNRTVLQILKRISKMKLKQLEFKSGDSTARIADIMSIIEQKVDILDISFSPIAHWAPRLQYFKRLKKIDAAQIRPRNLEAETKFWTAVAQLPNLNTVLVNTIPIPPRLVLGFPHLIKLKISLSLDLKPGEWTHSILTIFEQMTRLENLNFSCVVQGSQTRP